MRLQRSHFGLCFQRPSLTFVFGGKELMSKLTRSIIFGMLTALLAFGASAGLVAVGGYGPCGPASGISTAGVYLQMPAFFGSLKESMGNIWFG